MTLCEFPPFWLFYSLFNFQTVPQRHTDALSGQDGDLFQQLIDRAVIPFREPVRCAFQRHCDPLHAVVCLILLLLQLLDDGLAALELCHCRGDRLKPRGVAVRVVRIGGLAQQGGAAAALLIRQDAVNCRPKSAMARSISPRLMLSPGMGASSCSIVSLSCSARAL